MKERTSELEEAGRRFDVLWNQTRLAFGEHDVSEAKIVLDKLKAEGVTDFLAYVAAHPEVRRVCIAGVKTLNINDAFVKLLGNEDKSEMLTKRPQENLAREDNAILGLLAALFEGRDSCQGEVVLVGKDETRVPVAFQISMPSPTRCIVGVMDISERKRLEELQMEAQSELARANRVATMGAFTASLAHELNQPITAVMINAGNARRWLTRHLPMTDAALNSIDRIAAHAERAASIVRRTREQTVGAKRELAPVDLCKLAQETKVLLEWELKSRRTLLTVACQQGASVVLGDRIELQQVLINIIVNAADAVQDLDDRQRNVHIMVTPNGDDTVQLAISDTGQGIPSELIDKIFDPFFSTKEGGDGDGFAGMSEHYREYGWDYFRI